MEQKPIEMQIQDKIDEAINAYNKDDYVTYIHAMYVLDTFFEEYIQED